MVVKETGRTRVSGQTAITYHLFVSGLPKDLNTHYGGSLLARIRKPLPMLISIEDGLAVC